MNKNLKKLVTMGILVAMSVILIYIIRFPIIPGYIFLEYEPGDIPILIGGLIFGPVAGIVITIVASVIQALTVSAQSGWIGCIMHILATTALVGTAATVYKYKKTAAGLIIGLILGTIAMAAVMIPANLIFYPLFMGTPAKEVMGLIIPALLPFNLAKAGLNSLGAFIIFKSIGKLLIHMTEK